MQLGARITVTALSCLYSWAHPAKRAQQRPHEQSLRLSFQPLVNKESNLANDAGETLAHGDHWLLNVNVLPVQSEHFRPIQDGTIKVFSG